jgi:phosphate uptake regulator
MSKMVELRKLQKTGGTTFFVTLPKDWVLKHQLSTGDPLQLLPQSRGYLLITPLNPSVAGHPSQKSGGIAKVLDNGLLSTQVSLDPESSPDLARDILDHYMQGADVIRITSSSAKRLSHLHRETAKRLAQKLVGVETLDEDQHSITLQCLISGSTLPLITVLDRTYKIASNMHTEAIQSLVTLDPDLAKAVIARDEEVDRLYFLAVRQLRTLLSDPISANRAQISPLKVLDHRLFAKYIEALADHSASLATIAWRIYHLFSETPKQPSKLPTDITKGLNKLSQQAEERLDMAVKAYWENDIQVAASLRQIGASRNLAEPDVPSHGTEEAVLLPLLQNISKKYVKPLLHPNVQYHNELLALLATANSLLTRINNLAKDIGGLVTAPVNDM